MKIKKSRFAHLLGIALLGLGVLITSGFVLEKNTQAFSASYRWVEERVLALVRSDTDADVITSTTTESGV